MNAVRTAPAEGNTFQPQCLYARRSQFRCFRDQYVLMDSPSQSRILLRGSHYGSGSRRGLLAQHEPRLPVVPPLMGDDKRPAIFSLYPLEVILWWSGRKNDRLYVTFWSAFKGFVRVARFGRHSPQKLMAPLLIHFLCVATP